MAAVPSSYAGRHTHMDDPEAVVSEHVMRTTVAR